MQFKQLKNINTELLAVQINKNSLSSTDNTEPKQSHHTGLINLPVIKK